MKLAFAKESSSGTSAIHVALANNSETLLMSRGSVALLPSSVCKIVDNSLIGGDRTYDTYEFTLIIYNGAQRHWN